jgi:hypothetical protein
LSYFPIVQPEALTPQPFTVQAVGNSFTISLPPASVVALAIAST